ncbi:hypothetical protein EC2072C1_44500 (plasmid) [Escherichia coli]|nr:hypothetical protein EC2072C1_44500 [Escherichia coli]
MPKPLSCAGTAGSLQYMLTDTKLRNLKPRDKLYKVNDREGLYVGVASENGIYGHSRFCNTDFDDKLACLNLSGV